MLNPCLVTEQQMNRRIFIIFKPTEINIIKRRLAIKRLYLEKVKFLHE